MLANNGNAASYMYSLSPFKEEEEILFPSGTTF